MEVPGGKRVDMDTATNGSETLESASNELLLRTLYARDVTLRQCTDVDDKGKRCKLLTICKCKPKFYEEFESPISAETIHEADHRRCVCVFHEDLRRNNSEQRWCSNRVVLPNGDLQRCQHTGPYSAEFGSFFCVSCLAEHQEYKKAEQEKEKVAV